MPTKAKFTNSFPGHWAPPDLIANGIAWRRGERHVMLFNSKRHSLGSWKLGSPYPEQLWARMKSGERLECSDYHPMGRKSGLVMRLVDKEFRKAVKRG